MRDARRALFTTYCYQGNLNAVQIVLAELNDLKDFDIHLQHGMLKACEGNQVAVVSHLLSLNVKYDYPHLFELSSMQNQVEICELLVMHFEFHVAFLILIKVDALTIFNRLVQKFKPHVCTPTLGEYAHQNKRETFLQQLQGNEHKDEDISVQEKKEATLLKEAEEDYIVLPLDRYAYEKPWCKDVVQRVWKLSYIEQQTLSAVQLKDIFQFACEQHKPQIVQFCIDRKVNVSENALCVAQLFTNPKTLPLGRSILENHSSPNLVHYVFETACGHNLMDIVKKYKDSMRSVRGFRLAIKNDNSEIVHLLQARALKLCCEDIPWNSSTSKFTAWDAEDIIVNLRAHNYIEIANQFSITLARMCISATETVSPIV